VHDASIGLLLFCEATILNALLYQAACHIRQLADNKVIHYRWRKYDRCVGPVTVATFGRGWLLLSTWLLWTVAVHCSLLALGHTAFDSKDRSDVLLMV